MPSRRLADVTTGPIRTSGPPARLWLSGLRLREALKLCWDGDDKLSVDLSSRSPMLRIPADLEKGNEDRLLAIAPAFAEMPPALRVARRCSARRL
jgi:hypothetical protein